MTYPNRSECVDADVLHAYFVTTCRLWTWPSRLFGDSLRSSFADLSSCWHRPTITLWEVWGYLGTSEGYEVSSDINVPLGNAGFSKEGWFRGYRWLWEKWHTFYCGKCQRVMADCIGFTVEKHTVEWRITKCGSVSMFDVGIIFSASLWCVWRNALVPFLILSLCLTEHIYW